jgi:hypothetical protein
MNPLRIPGQDAPLTKTPSFFSAAMMDAEQNPFEHSFGLSNRGIDVSGQSLVQPVQSLRPTPSFFLDFDNGETCTPLFHSPKPKLYVNPLHQAQALQSPPSSSSAKESPASWPFSVSAQLLRHQVHRGSSLLQTVSSRNHPDSCVEYGQVTPPNENGDDGAAAAEPRQPKKAEPAPRGKPASRKKRAATQADNGKPAKRSRKGTRGKLSAGRGEAGMANPESEKRTKFLERNRVAASKCRQKKKTWTTELEAKCRFLQDSKQNQQVLIGSLAAEAAYLKAEILRLHPGCDHVELVAFHSGDDGRKEGLEHFGAAVAGSEASSSATIRSGSDASGLEHRMDERRGSGDSSHHHPARHGDLAQSTFRHHGLPAERRDGADSIYDAHEQQQSYETSEFSTDDEAPDLSALLMQSVAQSDHHPTVSAQAIRA